RNQYALRQQQDLLADLTSWIYGQAGQAKNNQTHHRPERLFSNLMVRALEDLEAVSIRMLRFPKDVGIGQIQVRAERNIDSPVTILGEARGAVRVPFGRATILRLSKQCKS